MNSKHPINSLLNVMDVTVLKAALKEYPMLSCTIPSPTNIELGVEVSFVYASAGQNANWLRALSMMSRVSGRSLAIMDMV